MPPAPVQPAPGNRPVAPAGRTAAWTRTEWAGLALAVAGFHLSFLIPGLGWAIAGLPGGLFLLRGAPTPRLAFRRGLLAGLLCYPLHLGFLWTIFGIGGVALWFILPFWTGLFTLLLHLADRAWGTGPAAWLAPLFWTGLEYVRGEVWWLKFTWFSAGSALPPPWGPLAGLGVYGTGWLLALVIPLAHRWTKAGTAGGGRHRLPVVAWVAALAALCPAWRPAPRAGDAGGGELKVAGVQLEFAAVPDVLAGLDRARVQHPEAQLFVLSEYTFDGPVPEPVRRWCREHRRWLVAGGKQALTPDDTRVAGGEHRPLLRPSSPAAPGAFRNTAFVIGPDGREVFSQAKAQPIQFFQDGLPAERQQVWESPWGRLGIAVCYDASYRRVMDPLVRQGAQALILPTMDVEEWGRHEHELNARQARLRAAEYRLPVFRLASSGPSELLEAGGRVIAAAGVPGQGEVLGGRVSLPARGRVPLDAWLAPGAALATAGAALTLAIAAARRRLRPPPAPPASTPMPFSR